MVRPLLHRLPVRSIDVYMIMDQFGAIGTEGINFTQMVDEAGAFDVMRKATGLLEVVAKEE